MSIGAVGSTSDQSIWELMKQRRAAAKDMESAVQAGDIAGAQQSLAVLQKDTQSLPPPPGGAGGDQGQNSFRAKIKTDLTALETAVKSGNITDAQSALTTLQSDRKGQATADSNNGSQSASSGNTFVADLTNLLNSALSGDTAGAQKAATSLQSDLQALTGAAGSTTSSATSSTGQTSQDSILDDLKALIAAGQSGDTATTTSAAQKLTQDLQGTAPGAAGQAGHHHHHHHHGGGTPPPADPATTAAANAATSGAASSQSEQTSA